ncbi:MAG: hypothetical protein AAF682_30105 [Planctomycetota bacterium]
MGSTETGERKALRREAEEVYLHHLQESGEVELEALRAHHPRLAAELADVHDDWC